MSTHTKGTICAAVAGVPNIQSNNYVLHHCVRTPGKNNVVALTGRVDTGDKDFDATSQADAVRLAACWNVFEGIATEDIARCHVVGKPIEAGPWSRMEDSRRIWGVNAPFWSWPSEAEKDQCTYQSAYKELYYAWIEKVVREINLEAIELRLGKSWRQAKAKEFSACSRPGASPVIDPVKPSADNSASHQFVCPTVEEIGDLIAFHYVLGGRKSLAESLARLIAEKNGGAA